MVAVEQDGIGGPQIAKLLQRHGGRLEPNGKYCGSCYGAEVTDDDCGNSCDEVREAYRKKKKRERSKSSRVHLEIWNTHHRNSDLSHTTNLGKQGRNSGSLIFCFC